MTSVGRPTEALIAGEWRASGQGPSAEWFRRFPGRVSLAGFAPRRRGDEARPR
ncbi:MAG: hypothetical protein AB7N76_31040 [Planctomycetota bacterium]